MITEFKFGDEVIYRNSRWLVLGTDRKLASGEPIYQIAQLNSRSEAAEKELIYVRKR